MDACPAPVPALEARQPRPAQAGARQVGALWALGFAALALGASAILVRWAAVPGAAAGFWRVLIAAAITAPAAWRQARRAEMPLRHVGFAVLAGVFFAADLTAWNTGVLVGSATNATLLANTAPLWVALGATLLFRQRLPIAFWLGLAAALAGVGLVVGGDALAQPSLTRGDLLGLLAGLFYGAFFLPSQRARERLPALVAWWIAAASSAVCLLAASLALGQPLTGYPAASWLWLAAVALLVQVGGYLAINMALGRLPASLVAPLLLLQPIVTALLAIPLLGERPTASHVAGGLLVLAGIVTVRRAHDRAAGGQVEGARR